MTTKVTQKEVKELSANDFSVRQAYNDEGEPLYVKMIQVAKIDKLDISQTLDFNRALLGQLDQFLFQDNFLKIQEQITNNKVVGLVTLPYKTTLDKYTKKNKIKQKQALNIFDNILKAIYSLYNAGFVSKNIRSQHFVLHQKSKTWKMQTLIYTHQYQQASGQESEYLWSAKHQAPECFGREDFSDQEFNPMIVWNLGCILVQCLVQTHKLSTLESMNKFKGEAFSFQKIGMNEGTWKHFSDDIQQILGKMLHYNPKKRMTLQQLFETQYLSKQVSQHFIKNKPKPQGKLHFGTSSVRMKQLSAFNQKALKQAENQLLERQKSRAEILMSSKLDLIDDKSFEMELGELSVKIPSKDAIVGLNKKKLEQQGFLQHSQFQQLLNCDKQQIKKSLQLYKSYFDQSQLLIHSVSIIQAMDFPKLQPQEVKQLKLLIKYSITLCSLINLNSLAQSFNTNMNILNLPPDDYILFSKSTQYHSLKQLLNFKRDERSKRCQQIRNQIKMLKVKPITTNNPFISQMVNVEQKRTTFQLIKSAYRFIVKHAYDQISEQFNEKKKTGMADSLSRIAMYVTYCLTIDKLYIKEDIPDNFKFFFVNMNKDPSNYVPVNQFKRYIEVAPKDVLIQNSRYILKKYYNL